jgi:hypothetical protein
VTDDDGIVRQRRHLHAAVAQVPPLDDEMPDGAFLVGWVLIAEFADPDGSRWFTARTGTDGGESELPPWGSKGYIAHALDEGLFDPEVIDGDGDGED